MNLAIWGDINFNDQFIMIRHKLKYQMNQICSISQKLQMFISKSIANLPETGMRVVFNELVGIFNANLGQQLTSVSQRLKHKQETYTLMEKKLLRQNILGLVRIHVSTEFRFRFKIALLLPIKHSIIYITVISTLI